MIDRMKSLWNRWVVKSLLLAIAVMVPTMALFIDENTSQTVAAIYVVVLFSFLSYWTIRFQDQEWGINKRDR